MLHLVEPPLLSSSGVARRRSDDALAHDGSRKMSAGRIEGRGLVRLVRGQDDATAHLSHCAYVSCREVSNGSKPVRLSASTSRLQFPREQTLPTYIGTS